MISFIFFIIIIFFLLLVFVPVILISIVRSIVSIFTGRTKQKVNDNNRTSSRHHWEHEATMHKRDNNLKKNRKIFDKDEGEYVSFEEVKDK
ncbi:MAG: DUF4834 family protein [Bacteroidaceae bacterium]|nr:DUF4834 family protein [Bacteroidaceae bacterium]